MRLLIVTQKVDRHDPILGFFHRWIEEFAKHCERVIVIGQNVGDYDLPKNVTVLSLGKEKGAWKVAQVLRYRWLLLRYRKEYDAIFVHMTPIWAVLAFKDALILRKNLYLWYEARGDRWPLKLALRIVKKVFSASPAGIPVQTPKSVITGHGIDTEIFSPGGLRDPHKIIAVGRVTASKQLHVIIGTLARLPKEFRLSVYGHAITAADHTLIRTLEKEDAMRAVAGRVEIGSVTHEEIVHRMRAAALFLHASKTSLDKALLEAMACGCLVVSCSEAARGTLPPECLSTAEGMADRAKTLLGLPEPEQEALRRQLREIVVRNHSLARLVERLVREMQA
ncbi:MAG: glycosyltransferase [Candidatus Peribacteraceae bacterium]|nr:glycosyltransferase [Candidatus Peribacteraceae bacterium]